MGTDLAVCQQCTQDVPLIQTPVEHATTIGDPHHQFFDENDCKDLTTVCMDGCSFHHNTVNKAGVGAVWIHDDEQDTLHFILGSQSSQYAEIAGILIVLQTAVERSVYSLGICTYSNYTRLSFSCHLATWKCKGYLICNKKAVKHKDFFMACDPLVISNNLQEFGKRSEATHVYQVRTKSLTILHIH